MKEIFIKTKNKIDADVTSKGFVLKGRTYYRLMQGYVQAMKIYTNNPSYSVRFYQAPLCRGIQKSDEGLDVSIFWSNGSSPFSLIELFTPSLAEPNPFGIKLTEENHIEEASEILKRSVFEYVLPYFEQSNTIENAYEAELEQSSSTFKNEREPKELALYHYSMTWYFWQLQMRNYSKAKKFLANAIEYYKINYPQVDTAEWTSWNRKFNENDIQYFENYIAEKQEESLSSLQLKRIFRKQENEKSYNNISG